MFARILVPLAEQHYRFGLIGISDFDERCRIAAWLDDPGWRVPDPRLHDTGEPDREREEEEVPAEHAVTSRMAAPQAPDTPGYVEFLFMGWVFTKADPDPYPATPHGHWLSQNRKWPKLDPYRGRAFSQKDSEDVSRRLSRSQMRLLWRNHAFRDFCREHLLWCRHKFPHHAFRVPPARLLALPRW